VRILVSIALAVVLFGGCATTPVRSSDAVRVPKERLLAFQEKTEKTSSTITITRDAGVMGSACNLVVRINGTNSAQYGVGETGSFYVEPGEVILTVGYNLLGFSLCGTGKITTREAYLRSGETKYFRITSDGFGGTDIMRSELE